MRTALLLLLTACLASASPGGDTLKSLLQEREQILVKMDDLMKERYKSGLCHWTETVPARLQLLEFRRDHTASRKERIDFQKEIVALHEEECRLFQEMLAGQSSFRLEAYRSREALLAAKCRLLEMESHADGEQQ
ncbi:hypothetical protein [uncultured Akkermansia sp.]|uniref:hypothetical protein n=1 Tax=uncultured Akkermansia sp. TaxID=512294 RepID=UPI00265D2864|nr:hypothetical protein [uncultured Akkermansia sp.]